MKVNLIALILFVGAMLACGGGGNGSGTTPPGTLRWQAVTTPFPQLNFIDFASNGHWFAADRNLGFYRSTDGGSSWTPPALPLVSGGQST